MKNSHVLIIGGTGFIGKCLVKSLKANGFTDILAVSRKNHLADISSKKNIEPFIAKADFVINMAGLVSFSKKHRKKLLDINNEGALNVLYLCEKHDNVKKLIHISSTASFGFHEDLVTEETFFDWEHHKHLGYSYSKFLPNKQINESKQTTNIVYPPLVIGPGDNSGTRRLFSYVRKKRRVLVPPGMNAVVDVRDLCEAITLILKKAKNKENYIVTNENVKLTELFSTIVDLLDQKTKISRIPGFLEKPIYGMSKFLEFLKFPIPSENIFFAFKDRIFSSSKIQTDLGFVPKYSYKQSLKDFLNTSNL